MVKGLDALHARFDAIPQRIVAEVTKQLEKEAAKVVADMKRLVPVETGALRDSIGWTWGAAPKGSLTIGSVKGRDYGRLSITIYVGTRDKARGNADAFYARWQEFGTVKMPANPFFFPAWRSNKTRVNNNIRGAIKRAVKAS